MRRDLLDTSILAAVLNDRPRAVSLVSPWINAREVTTSVLAYAEVLEYIKQFPDFRQRHEVLRNLLKGVHAYFLTYLILERYADIRRQLRPPHGPGLIGDIDTLIAATAVERSLTLVSTDADFDRVPGWKLMLIPRQALRTPPA